MEPSLCSRHIFSTSMAISTVVASKWNSSRNCAMRRSSPISMRWCGRSTATRRRRVRFWRGLHFRRMLSHFVVPAKTWKRRLRVLAKASDPSFRRMTRLIISRFPIPDSRFPIPDSRFPIPDSHHMSIDYKNTINLPKTEFAMRADLAKREPGMLADWETKQRYEAIQEHAAVREHAFILHDGPPYAN